MAALEMQGLGIVLAHVEQTDSVQLNPDRLRDLIGRGALVQVDAASFGGWNGARAERSAYSLLRAGMATFVASGAHAEAPYPQGLVEGLDALEAVLRRPREEAAWMVEAGPRQVIAGLPVRAPRLVPVPRGGFDPA
jgi:tyrosine-protein phosphatase YwqE